MSAVAPPGPSAPTPGDPSQQSAQLSWEGDKMFNIYIHDYCSKRGYRKTAHELLAEAGIPPDAAPPINARQGLLFEWWSVFWVLFGAKSNGNGSEDALLYVQHQAQQAAQRQHRLQPQSQMNRFMNSVPRQPGVMPNGIGHPLQGQGPVSFPMAVAGPQPNGIPGPVGAQSALGASGQPSNFPPLLHGGQRPPPGMQRVPNGMAPFQSPTMAHSPAGGAPQHAQPPINQLGPSPHLSHMNRGGMLPPNGPQGMNNPPNMGSAQTPMSTQSYQQIPRPPSRSGTPIQNSMMQPSPSMANRQIQGPLNRQAQEQMINNDFSRLPSAAMLACKQEAGIADKDVQALTMDDKQHILAVAKRRGAKPGPPGPNNGGAGPSGSNQSLSLTQRNQQPQQPQPQPQPQRGNKRSSTSPTEEHDTLIKTESSPPERKRARRSPMGMDQTPMATMSYQQGGPGVPQQMPNGMMRGPMGNQPMNGFVPQPGMPTLAANPAMGLPLGQIVPQMGSTMSPGMSHPGPGGLMAPQQLTSSQLQQQFQYRQSMHNLHKGGMPLNALPTAGSPSAADSPFMPGGPQGQGSQFPGGGPNTRMGPSKPMTMMPPPSPGMNGPVKDQQVNKDGKSGNLNPSGGLADDSSRNGGQNMGGAAQGGTAPPTPGPNQGMTAPSPSAILSNSSINLGGPQATNGPDSMATSLFSNDLIMSVASSMDELDPSLFRPDSDINFERDFGQWFNPDDVSLTDLK